MRTFQKVKIKDMIDHLIDNRGKTPPIIDSGHELVEVNAIVEGKRSPQFILVKKFVSEETYKSWFRTGNIKKGDVLIPTVGTIGSAALAGEDRGAIAQNIIGLRTKPNINSTFLYYKLISPQIKGIIQSLNIGVAQPSVKVPHLMNLELDIPDSLLLQKKIANILTAYDDLIENNEKRINALEEMAQLLYTEWFINPIKNGLPKGWKIQKLEEVTSLITKGTTPTTLKKDFVQSGINFIKIESIGNHGDFIETKFAKIDTETHDLLKRSKIQDGDVLFSIAGAIGRTALITKRFLPANTNQALAIIRPKEELLRYYLYQVISSLDFLNFSKGRIVQTAQANVSLGALSSAEIVLPTNEILIKYNLKIKNIFETIDKISSQNQNLSQTRDLLIPQLVTGKRELK